jgi:CRP-like cAMP-binding protein
MPQPSINLFLASLSDKSRELLLAQSKEVTLPLRSSLYQPRLTPAYAYLLTSGMASVVASTGAGGTVEVGVIGHEGIVGAFHLLGPAPVSTASFMQLAGSGIRIPFAKLRAAFRSSEDIRDRILQFVQEQALTVSQLAGCNRLHEADERLARWLLMASDRTQSDTLNFTQEFLGMMLGAQRTTVTSVAGGLQERGFIEYKRGRVKILNREALEAAACDCYQITKQLYQQPLQVNDERGPESPKNPLPIYDPMGRRSPENWAISTGRFN